MRMPPAQPDLPRRLPGEELAERSGTAGTNLVPQAFHFISELAPAFLLWVRESSAALESAALREVVKAASNLEWLQFHVQRSAAKEVRQCFSFGISLPQFRIKGREHSPSFT
jgi:hypothetical protein